MIVREICCRITQALFTLTIKRLDNNYIWIAYEITSNT